MSPEYSVTTKFYRNLVNTSVSANISGFLLQFTDIILLGHYYLVYSKPAYSH